MFGLFKKKSSEIYTPVNGEDRNYLAEHKKDDIVIVVFPEMKDKELETSLGEKQVGEIAAVIK